MTAVAKLSDFVKGDVKEKIEGDGLPCRATISAYMNGSTIQPRMYLPEHFDGKRADIEICDGHLTMTASLEYGLKVMNYRGRFQLNPRKKHFKNITKEQWENLVNHGRSIVLDGHYKYGVFTVKDFDRKIGISLSRENKRKIDELKEGAKSNLLVENARKRKGEAMLEVETATVEENLKKCIKYINKAVRKDSQYEIEIENGELRIMKVVKESLI